METSFEQTGQLIMDISIRRGVVLSLMGPGDATAAEYASNSGQGPGRAWRRIRVK